MSFEASVTIVLAALCAMLAILTLFIGALAFWGYSGIKKTRKSIETDVKAKADAALASKLSEYPDAQSILRMFNGLKEQFELMEQLRNQMTPTESNHVVEASNPVQDRVDQASESIADDYPNGKDGGKDEDSQ